MGTLIQLARLRMILVIAGLLLPIWGQAQDSALETDIERAVEKALPSMVQVLVKHELDPDSFGAGIVIDALGYILVCDHVVSNAKEIFVTLSDGTEFPAKLIIANTPSDVALLKIGNLKPLTPIGIGDSSKLKLGSPVLALGNPMGEGMTVTQGILSARLKKLWVTDQLTYQNLLQTDAAINPGNSGGALINRSGEMVGFVVAIRARAQGMSYAIDVETARERLGEVLRESNNRDSVLGLTARSDRKGVLIQNVSAETATQGFIAGDRIRRVGGRFLRDETDLALSILDAPKGEPLRLEIQREGLSEPLFLEVPVK